MLCPPPPPLYVGSFCEYGGRFVSIFFFCQSYADECVVLDFVRAGWGRVRLPAFRVRPTLGLLKAVRLQLRPSASAHDRVGLLAQAKTLLCPSHEASPSLGLTRPTLRDVQSLGRCLLCAMSPQSCATTAETARICSR